MLASLLFVAAGLLVGGVTVLIAEPDAAAEGSEPPTSEGLTEAVALSAVTPEDSPAGEEQPDEALPAPELPSSTPDSEEQELSDEELEAARGAVDDGSESARRFAEEFPEHADAFPRPDEPASSYWAVLVGVNDYHGPVSDTFGSVADVETLREVLLDAGWRPENILELTDRDADRDRIVLALEWLQRVTDEDSTVVFSFSGHLRHDNGVTALWPTDNGFIWRDELAALLEPIEGRAWLTFQGCHAGGLAAEGTAADGRIVTYSSKTEEKSYEDPETEQSVAGYYMFTEGIAEGWADTNDDGRVSVQDAFEWGGSRATIRTADLQTPQLDDRLDRPFYFEIETPRPPAASPYPGLVR